MKTSLGYWASLWLLIVFPWFAGCESRNLTSPNGRDGESGEVHSQLATSEPAPTLSESSQNDSEHGHKPGQHGGIMISLGRDSYHVEAVVDNQGVMHLYTLGNDETRVMDVELQTLKGFVKAVGNTESLSINFEPSPQDGDAPDKTSLFIGKLPPTLSGQDLEVTIPNIRISGERFRLGFKTSSEQHPADTPMPEGVLAEDEEQLYLTPAGRYTSADIAANGNMTAMQKFKGIKSAHDMHPKVGDLICPITETKANPQFTWIIDGRPYQFCCPPCIDEFLKNAKAKEVPLPDPETYVKQ